MRRRESKKEKNAAKRECKGRPTKIGESFALEAFSRVVGVADATTTTTTGITTTAVVAGGGFGTPQNEPFRVLQTDSTRQTTKLIKTSKITFARYKHERTGKQEK